MVGKSMGKKKLYKKRNVKKNRKTNLSAWRPPMKYTPDIIPNSLVTKLKYGDVWELASGGASTVASTLFNINSIYDPLNSIGGGQPSGHDQLATLYSKYRVYAVKLRVHVINTTAYPVFATMTWGDGDNVWPNASGTDVQQYALEMPNTKSLELLPYTYGDKCSGWMSKFVKMSDIWRGQDVTGTDFTALCGANPTKLAYMNVSVADVTGARTTITATAIVKLTYYCKFFGKKTDYED